MARRTGSTATEQVYRLLPDYVRGADEQALQLLDFLDGASTGIQPAVDFVNLTDPDTSVTGTCELVNATAAPRPFLGWLGWLVGIDTTTIDDAYVRDALANASRAQRRGTVGAIKDVVQRTLTGSRSVRVYPNLSGTDPYRITVVTSTSQTPDPTATLLAAESEKPAGMTIELQTVAGSTYIELAAAYPTYDDVDAAFPTYDDLTSWIPGA